MDRPIDRPIAFVHAHPVAVGVGLAALIGLPLAYHFHPEWFWPKAIAGSVTSHSYRGYTFEVGRFADWYNGTGWRFLVAGGMPLPGSPGATGKQGARGWGGLFASDAEAIASAQYSIDLALDPNGAATWLSQVT